MVLASFVGVLFVPALFAFFEVLIESARRWRRHSHTHTQAPAE
jgi:hypothetical protein